MARKKKGEPAQAIFVSARGNDMTAGNPEITNGSTVADNKTVKFPFVSKNLTEVTGIAATGFSVDTLIGAHHLGYMAVLYQGLESGQVGFP